MLYLKGVSTGNACNSLVGPSAKGFSLNDIVRLKERWSREHEEWSRRDVFDTTYVYVWVDGIHVTIRLGDEADSKQCLLVLMGATADGRKELIAVVDGVRMVHKTANVLNKLPKGLQPKAKADLHQI